MNRRKRGRSSLFWSDAMNRINEVDHTVGAGSGGTADGLSLFSYDKASQLTAADHTPPRPDEAYQFDADGNRTGGTIQNGGNNQTVYDGTYTYVYDKGPHKGHAPELS